jgi:hypothetical protein
VVRICFFLLMILILSVQSPFAAAQSAIVADHTTTNLLSIPDDAVLDASNLKVSLRRASVGGNISDGLDSLQSRNAKYNRAQWVFANRGNSDWKTKIDEMVSFTISNASSYDVLSMKLCFIDSNASFYYYRDKFLWLENNYPGKRFIWWTIPIETIGKTNRQAFNDSVRAYAIANGKILFDIADIEACNTAGVKQVDGSYREIMRAEWTSDGGHLNTAGAQRAAGAFWWLMAKIAGWDGELPVQISAFSAIINGMDAELHWSTATEKNNYGFDIERRKAQGDESTAAYWGKIGFVAGNGTGNSPREYSFTDPDLEPGRYIYRLKQADNDGTFEYSQNVELEILGAPKVFTLSQNYPNPFNPTTMISFTLAENSKVVLKVYNMLGKEVALLLNGTMISGIQHNIQFDASKFSSGMYFYRLEAGKNSLSRKCILLK